jgi:hypothetical protein
MNSAKIHTEWQNLGSFGRRLLLYGVCIGSALGALGLYGDAHQWWLGNEFFMSVLSSSTNFFFGVPIGVVLVRRFSKAAEKVTGEAPHWRALREFQELERRAMQDLYSGWVNQQRFTGDPKVLDLPDASLKEVKRLLLRACKVGFPEQKIIDWYKSLLEKDLDSLTGHEEMVWPDKAGPIQRVRVIRSAGTIEIAIRKLEQHWANDPPDEIKIAPK